MEGVPDDVGSVAMKVETEKLPLACQFIERPEF